MSIYIEKVRIQNFRSLHSVEVSLSPSTTLLVGANNSGKTSFLRAISIALNSDRKLISLEDLFIDQNGSKSNKVMKIDIKIVSVNSQNFGNQWTSVFGNNIRQDRSGKDFFAFRTIIDLNEHVKNALVQRSVIDDWESGKSRENEDFFVDLSTIPFYFIDAQRDLYEDIFSRTSHFGRLTSRIEYGDEQRATLENTLAELNKSATEQSTVLTHLKDSLAELNKTVQTKGQGVEITPFPKKIRDLYKGIKVHFQDGASDSFSLEYHGMGTRSWAALLAFKAHISWDTKERNEENKAFFPVLALEEPEAHLHPNAQRQVYKQLTEISVGQKIISTHSPYIAAQAELENIRHFCKETDKTKVSQIDWEKQLENSDKDNRTRREEIAEITRKIRHTIINTRGELLFAKAVVLFEGETEEQALPIFAEKYWGVSPFEKGVCFIGVGGNNYKGFLQLLVTFNIKWFIFSDYDNDSIRKGVDNALALINFNNVDNNVIRLEMTFENYLVAQGYQEQLKNGIIEEYCSVENNQMAINPKREEVNNYDDEKLRKSLKENKTKYASFYARKIANMEDNNRRFPNKVRELFEAIDRELTTPTNEI